MIDLPAYLARIEFGGSTNPNTDTLRSLQRAHMLSVPFENLDISAGRPIICDEDSFLHKIVNERRGGFCYELNGAFAALLRALGFKTTLLSARVPRAASDGPEFDHLALRVDLEEPWLVDVGFGDSFLDPLRLISEVEQEQAVGKFRIHSQAGDTFVMQRFEAEKGWRAQYSFTLEPRALNDFAGMCHYHQTSPESHFTQKRICSLATADGRITLSDTALIVTRNGKREERVLTENQRNTLLRERFGVSL